MLGAGIKLGAVRLLAPQGTTGQFDDHHLQAQAQPQVGHPVLPRPTCSGDLALDAPFAKTSRHHHAGYPFQFLPPPAALQRLGTDIVHVNVPPVRQGRVVQRLAHADVGIVQFDVFAHDGNGQRGFGSVDAIHEFTPLPQIRRSRL